MGAGRREVSGVKKSDFLKLLQDIPDDGEIFYSDNEECGLGICQPMLIEAKMCFVQYQKGHTGWVQAHMLSCYGITKVLREVDAFAIDRSWND
jgi:hypothetical protein